MCSLLCLRLVTNIDVLQVRFDTDAELDLALRISPSPLRLTIERAFKREPRSAAATRAPVAQSTAAPSRDVPSKPGYAFASTVGSGTSDDGGDDDLVMVDLPTEVRAPREVDNDAAPEADSAHNEDEFEVDAPAAFEVEAAAARDPEGSMLYQKASIRLAKRHGVHLTPSQLWRVMALFHLQGRKLVIWGLAPHRALDVSAGGSSSAGGGSSDDEDEGANKKGKKRGGGLGRGSHWATREQGANPVQHLLEVNGVQIPEQEVVPLLEALRILPRRLVKLKLLTTDELAGFLDANPKGPSGRGTGPSRHIMHMGSRFGRGGGGRGPGRGRGPPPPFHHMYMMSAQHGVERDHHPPHMPFPGHAAAHHMAHMTHMFGGYPHLHDQHLHDRPRYPPPPHAPPGSDDHDGEAEWYVGPPPGVFPHPWHSPGSGRGHYSGGVGHVFGPGGRGGGGRGCGKGGKESMAMARFVEHRSPSLGNDVAHVSPGQSFKKSWLVRNDSSTPWPEEVSLVPVSRGCQDLSSPPEAAVVGGVAPGEEAEVAVDLVAPMQAGMYEGYWRTFGAERRFGQRLWAKVMVVSAGRGVDVNAGVERMSLDDRNKDN